MSDTVIKVEHLSKKYLIGHQANVGKNGSLRTAMTDGVKSIANIFSKRTVEDSTHEEFWALNDVSFDIKQGDRVGIIGRNGAGKSTLLKIISRITEPTKGRITIEGRVASLLEVGTGFHVELTGRENIFLNGAILGMSQAEIRRKFDEIVAFSEVERFLDTPVKRYSSGMYVRLAFAVAAHLEPEILIVDEVLAVGDLEFQKKCMGKMRDIGAEGRTVLFVSHNMGAIEALCNSSFVLSKGQVIFSGSTQQGITKYMESIESDGNQVDFSNLQGRKGNGALRFTGLKLAGDYVTENTVTFGKPVDFEIFYESEKELNNVLIRLGIYDRFHQGLAWFSSEMIGTKFDAVNKKGKFICRIDKFPFTPNDYFIDIECRISGHQADWIEVAKKINVIEGDFYGTGRMPDWGVVTVPHHWEVSYTD
jgi:lipopolysaccharide transport system ATP-binding protein